jgi:hypothetical protein
MKLMTASRWTAFVLCGGLVAACGGGSDVAAPAPQAAPPAPAIPQNSEAAFAVFEAAQVHASMTASPFMWTDAGSAAPTGFASGACRMGGSTQVAIDGASPRPDALLPTGSHTYAVTFSNCVVDGLVGIVLNGTATAVYSTADWSDVTAQVNVGSMRGTGSLGFHSSAMSDVSARGSGTWRTIRTASGGSTTYTPAPGSTLVSNRTTNVITFDGGSFTVGYENGPPAASRWSFTNLAVTLNGAGYLLDGSLQRTFANGLPVSGSGEVRVTSNATLVARVFVDASGTMRSEALAPLVSF